MSDDFGGLISDPSALNVGMIPRGSKVPQVDSGMTSVAKGIGVLGNLAAQVGPMMEKAAIDSEVKDFVTQYQTMHEGFRQGSINRSALTTQQREWETRLEKATPGMADAVKKQLGIQSLNVAEERESTSDLNNAATIYGNTHFQHIPDPEQRFQAGYVKVLQERRSALLHAQLKRDSEVQGWVDERKTRAVTDLTTQDFNDTINTHVRAAVGLYSKVDVNTPEGQKQALEIAQQLEGVGEVFKTQQHGLHQNAYGTEMVDKALGKAMSPLKSVVDNLRSNVKEVQEAQVKLLQYAATSQIQKVADSGNALGQMMLLTDDRGRVINTIIDKMIQEKGALLGFTESLGKVNTVGTSLKQTLQGGMASVKPNESGPQSHIAKTLASTKREAQLRTIKGANQRLHSTEVLVETLNKRHKEGNYNPEDAPSYGVTVSNVLDGLQMMKNTANANKLFRFYNSPEHDKIMAQADPTQRKALEAKVFSTALEVSRKAAKSIGGNLPSTLGYNAATGQWSFNVQQAQPYFPPQETDTEFPTDQGQTVDEEALRRLNRIGPEVRDTMNNMMAYMMKASKDDPRLASLSDIERGYLVAEQLRRAIGSNITIENGEAVGERVRVALEGKGSKDVTLQQALQDFQKDIGDTQQKLIFGDRAQAQPQQIGDTITPAPNPAPVERQEVFNIDNIQTVEATQPDGTRSVFNEDGTTTNYKPDGTVEVVLDEDEAKWRMSVAQALADVQNPMPDNLKAALKKPEAAPAVEKVLEDISEEGSLVQKVQKTAKLVAEGAETTFEQFKRTMKLVGKGAEQTWDEVKALASDIKWDLNPERIETNKQNTEGSLIMDKHAQMVVNAAVTNEKRPTFKSPIDEDFIDKMSQIIAMAESGGEENPQSATNDRTSATGYFQLVNDTRRSAAQSLINLSKETGDSVEDWVKSAAGRMSKDDHVKFVSNLNYEQQQALVVANWFSKNGSDLAFKKLAKGKMKQSDLRQFYMKFHHTQPSPVLARHFDRAFDYVGVERPDATADALRAASEALE